MLDATTPTTLELTDLLNTEENEEETGLFNMDSPLCQLDEDEQDPLDMVASFLNTPKPRFSNDDQSEIVTTVARSEPKITEMYVNISNPLVGSFVSFVAIDDVVESGIMRIH